MHKSELSLYSLKESLAGCAQQGLDRAEPWRYFYVQALLDNLANRPHLSPAVSQRLLVKATKIIADIQKHNRMNTAQSENHAAEQALVPSGLTQLRALNRQLHNQMDRGLSEQEKSAQESDTGSQAKAKASLEKSELQALRHYQQLFEKMAVERLLSKVMQEIPENAGPLNPERVVIRCLSALQEISPAYVMRLMGYYESLISLQSLPLGEK